MSDPNWPRLSGMVQQSTDDATIGTHTLDRISALARSAERRAHVRKLMVIRKWYAFAAKIEARAAAAELARAGKLN